MARKGGRSRAVDKLASEGLSAGHRGYRRVAEYRRFREIHVDREARKRKRQNAYVRQEHLIIRGNFSVDN